MVGKKRLCPPLLHFPHKTLESEIIPTQFMFNESFKQFYTELQIHFKRLKGLNKCLADFQLQALHNLCVQLDVTAINTQLVNQTRFVVIDTETTGLHAYSGDEIISICMLEMQGLTLTGQQYQTYVDPARPIPAESTAIHGICTEDVACCPKIGDILKDVIEFMDKSVIIGHHLNFDLRFLNKTLQKQLLCKLRNPWIDTMLLYIAYSGRIGHYSLDEVTEICQVTNPARHTAYGDAIATALIFQKITAKMLSPTTQINDLIKQQFEVGLF